MSLGAPELIILLVMLAVPIAIVVLVVVLASRNKAPAFGPGVVPMVGGMPAGSWAPDPAQRFEQRYWDGTAWTAHVMRDGQPSVDPEGAPGQ